MISRNLENIVLEPQKQPKKRSNWVKPLLIGIGVLSASASMSYLASQQEQAPAQAEIHIHTPCIQEHEQYTEVKPCYQQQKNKLLISYE